MALTRLTALDGDSILSLADAKAQCRVLHDDEDDLIEQYRDAAVRHVERVSGVIMAPADFRWTGKEFGTSVSLPVSPVTEIGTVEHLDGNGDTTEYTGARLIAGTVVPAFGGSWPFANGYASIEFTAGLASPTDAPELIAAVKLKVEELYARGDTDFGDQIMALVNTHLKVMI